MTELEFAEKYDYEGGGVDALLGYGLSARDLDVKAGALYEAVKRFDDEYRPGLLALLDKIEGLVGEVSDLVGKPVLFNGKRGRIMAYWGKNRFDVLDSADDRRIVHRDQLTFLKG